MARKFGNRKGKKVQESRAVWFRPDLPQTFRTLDLALITYPETDKKSWLKAASTLEYQRFDFLLKAMARGEIKNLHFQPEFIILPQTLIPACGAWPKHTQAQRKYTADMAYTWCSPYGELYIVEDVKAAFSNSEKNREAGRAGKPIKQGDSNLRQKFLAAHLAATYGAIARFKIVTAADMPLSEEGYA